MRIRSIVAAAAAMLLLFACETVTSNRRLSVDQREAVCRAQQFLGDNGYLDSTPLPDRKKIALELRDQISYTKDGELDWDALFTARRGTFSGRLFGVKPVESGYFAAYEWERGFRCLFVGSGDSTDIRLNEADCRPVGSTFVRIDEASLSCLAVSGR